MHQMLQHKPAASLVFTGREYQPALTAPMYLALLEKKIITELTWQPGCAQITWLEQSRAPGPRPQMVASPTLLQPRGDSDGILLFPTAARQNIRGREVFVHF